MPSSNEPSRSKTYWRSLEELADSGEFREWARAEFPTAESEGVSRRQWLQLMGALLALAGVAGCRWEKAEIHPFAKRPQNRIPGKPQHFATAMDLGGTAVGLLVTSFEGRPIKIEGNPRHPGSLGATDAHAQAAILELYDPDRSQGVCNRKFGVEAERVWSDFAEFAEGHFSPLRKSGGDGLRILSEATSSPTLAAIRAELLKEYPKARWYEYEPISTDNERAGAELAFGRSYRTHLALDKARVIVCLDADPLAEHAAAVRNTHDFAKARDPAGAMNRLYSVESVLSLTGSVADHRLSLRCSQIGACAQFLEQWTLRDPPAAGSRPQGLDDKAARFLHAAAEDLKAHRGECVVIAGPRQPPEVHATVHRINAALGSAGTTLTYFDDPDAPRQTHVNAIGALVAEMSRGEVKTLVIVGGNPDYNAPADLEFGKALAEVETSIHLGLYVNETARKCTWHIPQAHFLECWGDARWCDGTYSIVQPLLEPLYGGKSAIEFLAFVMGKEPTKGYEQVRETFKRLVGTTDWEPRWDRTLHDGLLEGSAWKAAAPRLTSQPEAAPAPVDPAKNPLEIVFCRDRSVYDGRFGNSGWLQELPDPTTKIAWGNAALLSPATAKELNVEDGNVVRLRYGGKAIEIPAYLLPGQADGSVAVALGYGRTSAGHVGGSLSEGAAAVGVDVYPLRTSQAMDFDSGLTLERTGKNEPLALTHNHHVVNKVGLEAKNQRIGELVREATLAEIEKDPKLVKRFDEELKIVSLWEEPKYEGHRWGISIDLSRCTGCSACVVACQAENNVPVVGKERVLQGREMQWIRIDRYFRGDPQSPSVSYQPVACQQCENAPCEQVCPVGATVHSHEGLNDMVYNRCVGTRYCANNCPYKVRRFNFFNYHRDLEDPKNEVLKMLYSPEVTVRSRGVMEKCTYCVQRVQAAKIEAKNNRRDLADGQIRTACQQVCPAGAIVFGDLNDPKSAVSKAAAADRAYRMLAELNVRPRTSYLAKIRNPNPALET